MSKKSYPTEYVPPPPKNDEDKIKREVSEQRWKDDQVGNYCEEERVVNKPYTKPTKTMIKLDENGPK